MRAPALLLLLILASSPLAAEVTLEQVTVGGPPNACDPQSQGCFGAVAAAYRIGAYEVTNAQYAEFLNDVAASDPNALYHVNMGIDFGGIARSGSAGSFSYATIAGRADLPVNWVSFWDAARFANWLHNGQPSGAQGNATTEDGAYTLTPTGIANNTVTRNGGASFAVASEDEWYKAAYYDSALVSYFDYPAGSDTATTCAAPGATPNTANCDAVQTDLTGVGSYTGSPSPAATFDQGGNVFEWMDTIADPASRISRGGSLNFGPGDLAAATRLVAGPTFEGHFLGFRISSPIPTSPVPALGPLATALMAGSLAIGAHLRLRRPRR